MPKIAASTALSRLRILDLSRVRAGPTCVKQFADFGADVIKIESPPGVDPNEAMGGPREGPDMQNLHRNKRAMTLNLKLPEAREVLARLVKTADVVVENYRPDVKARLGIDYQSLERINPRIILASISGFGQDGPYRDRPGFDQAAQGMSGLMSVTGLPGQEPVRNGPHGTGKARRRSAPTTPPACRPPPIRPPTATSTSRLRAKACGSAFAMSSAAKT